MADVLVGVVGLLGAVCIVLGAACGALVGHCRELSAQRDRALVDLVAEEARHAETQECLGDAFRMVRAARTDRKRALQRLRTARGLLEGRDGQR